VFRAVDGYLSGLSRVTIFIVGVLLTALIGAAYYLTGSELAVSLFYLIPISMVTWYCARWGGYFLSCICFDIWLLADVAGANKFSRDWVPFLNDFLRLALFLTYVTVLSMLKSSLDRETKKARRDPLTGLFNRLGFAERAEIEVARARRNREPITLAAIDLDDFKLLNDRLGHSTGDMLLETVADTLRSSMREVDVVARFGGDEFVILFAVSDGDLARPVLERLHRDLNREMKLHGWPVSFSIGALTFGHTVESLDHALERADELMYSVKRSNKNRIAHEIVTSMRANVETEKIPQVIRA